MTSSQSNIKKEITILITGGGTGGHIYPAIAVAQELKTRENVKKIYYMGNPEKLEYSIAQTEGYDFLPVKVSGMPRKASLQMIMWASELCIASFKAAFYLKNHKIDIVFGTGGYVSAPALIAARFLGIPFAIHDCDANPGLVSRAMSVHAKAITIAFESAKKHLHSGKNIIVSGNPIRNNFKNLDKEKSLQELNLNPNKKTLLVMGGSQGAASINNALAPIIKDLTQNHNIQIIHQTGKKNMEKYIEELDSIYPEHKNNPDYLVQPYFDDMSIPLACADLVVSRAGSLSISELNLCALPAILIPYPHAAADHQRHNAREMEKLGASIYLDDNDCNSESLKKVILEIIHNPQKLTEMKAKTKALATPLASQKIADIILAQL